MKASFYLELLFETSKKQFVKLIFRFIFRNLYALFVIFNSWVFITKANNNLLNYKKIYIVHSPIYSAYLYDNL